MKEKIGKKPVNVLAMGEGSEVLTKLKNYCERNKDEISLRRTEDEREAMLVLAEGMTDYVAMTAEYANKLLLENHALKWNSILREIILTPMREMSEEALSFIEKEFTGKHVTLIQVETKTPVFPRAEEQVLEIAHRLTDKSIFCLCLSKARELFFVISDRNPYERSLRSFGEELRKRIKVVLSTDSTIMIGMPDPNGRTLDEAFEKFENLEENRFFLREGDVLIDRKIYTRKDRKDETLESIIVRIHEDVRYKEFERAEEGVKQLVSRILLENCASNIYVRHIFVELLSTLAQNCENMTNSENMDNIRFILTAPDIFSIEERMVGLLKKAEKNKEFDEAEDYGHTVAAVIKIIRTEFDNPDLNTAMVASKVFLSPNYLSAMFKRTTGKSVSEFIKQYRIEKAKYLLKETNIKIGDIARQIGYSNDGYFVTAFKSAVGITPARFREN